MNWDQLWIDINLATMSNDNAAPYGQILDAAIAIVDDKIAWIGPRADLPEFDLMATPIYKGNGAWVTPGLIDAHTHLIFGGNRANEFEMRLKGQSYQQIIQQGGGILATVEATRQTSEGQLFELGRKRLNALAKEGVTTVEIKSGYGLNTETEIKILRVARELGKHHHVDVNTTFLGAHCIAPEYKDDAEGYIDLIINDMLPQVIAEDLADAVDVFCEQIAFNLEQTKKIFNAAQQSGLAIKLHGEQLSYTGSAELAANMGALSVDHLEYLDEKGVQALKNNNCCAVLLPGAYYFLKETQMPPIELLRQYKVPMVVASDFNPGSSPFCSTLLMLNFSCTLFGLTPEEALAGVTRNAAKALAIDNKVGVLTKGMQADFCLWDISNPAELAYCYGTNPCIQVIKAGKLVHQ